MFAHILVHCTGKARFFSRQSLLGLLIAMLWCFCLSGCGTRTVEKYVVIEVDGKSIQMETNAVTIAEALGEARVQLGPLDRVTPDLNEPTDRSNRIIVTRVR